MSKEGNEERGAKGRREGTIGELGCADAVALMCVRTQLCPTGDDITHILSLSLSL